MHAKHSFIDNPHQAISNGRWHATWFLIVEDLFPLKYGSPKYGQEALDLRSRSYKFDLNSSNGEKVVTNKKLQVDSRSIK
jgi:hypothetical protein